METLDRTEIRLHLDDGQVALFGYGSLILLESMERTLGRKYTLPRYACYLRGWKRVWTSLYPNSTFYFLGPDGERSYPKNILYLNICRSDVSINGIIYVVEEADLLAFDKREYIYGRIDVAADIQGLHVTGGPVWVYVGIPPFVVNELPPISDAAVRASYVRIVEKGLDELGLEFRREYEASSTPVPISNLIDDHQA